MKIDKKLIKELVENLKEFGLTELEYKMDKQKLKFQKHQKFQNKLKQVQLFLQKSSFKYIFK